MPKEGAATRLKAVKDPSPQSRDRSSSRCRDSVASGAAAAKRLRALEKTNDGFKLAEADLEARGAGDLYGRQQWGVTDLGMEALKNVKLIRAAREEAERLIQTDVTLSTYPTLRERVERASAESHRE